MVFGIDLVVWQIRIAAGEVLQLDQRALEPTGHSIECRITAEDATNDFAPNVGTVENLSLLAVQAFDSTPIFTRAIAFHHTMTRFLESSLPGARTRDEAIARLERALAELVISGIIHTGPFHRPSLPTNRFVVGNVHTGLIAEMLQRSGAADGPFERPLAD